METFNVKAYLVQRDIFPKWVVDAGIIRKGLLYRFFKFIELKLYKNADFIGIESKFDINYFLKYVTQEKVEVLNNWGSPLNVNSLFTQGEKQHQDQVNILYGGNMGDAQDLLGLVKMVDPEILSKKAKITLVGSGNQKNQILNYIKANKIENIEVLPEVNREQYLRILANADIGLVSLNKKLASNNFPLKMMGYIQFSKPIIASVNEGNEIIDLINDHSIGLVSIAGDGNGLNKNLEELINNETLRKEQGRNAIDLFNKKFTVQVAAQQILERLQ